MRWSKYNKDTAHNGYGGVPPECCAEVHADGIWLRVKT